MIYRVDMDKEASMIRRFVARLFIFIALGTGFAFPLVLATLPSAGPARTITMLVAVPLWVLSGALGLFLAIRRFRNEVESMRFEITDEFISVDSIQQRKRIALNDIESIKITPEHDILIHGRNSIRITVPREVKDGTALLEKIKGSIPVVQTKSRSLLVNYFPAVALGLVLLLGYFKLYLLYLVVGIPSLLATVFLSYSLVVGALRWKYKVLPLALNVFIIVMVARNSMAILDAMLKGSL